MTKVRHVERLQSAPPIPPTSWIILTGLRQALIPIPVIRISHQRPIARAVAAHGGVTGPETASCTRANIDSRRSNICLSRVNEDFMAVNLCFVRANKVLRRANIDWRGANLCCNRADIDFTPASIHSRGPNIDSRGADIDPEGANLRPRRADHDRRSANKHSGVANKDSSARDAARRSVCTSRRAVRVCGIRSSAICHCLFNRERRHPRCSIGIQCRRVGPV
jgi:hypothetical protein